MLLLSAHTGQAQRAIGVSWNVPDDPSEALEQLAAFERMEISHLEVDRPLEERLWNSLGVSGISVWAVVPVEFPTHLTFARPDSITVAKIEDHLNHYLGREPVSAVRLFTHGAAYDPRFEEALAPYTGQIRELFGGSLYDLRNISAVEDRQLLDFSMYTVRVQAGYTRDARPEIPKGAGAWLYRPTPEMEPYLGPLKSVLDETAGSPDTPLFLPSGWLLDRLQQHPSLAETIRRYATDEQAVFPLPEESYPRGEQFGLGVFLLLLLWGTVALNYSISPLYRRSARRFFSSHRFYVNDVIHRHVRAPTQGVIMLVQHSLLSGILFYSIGKYLLSTTGTEALLHYFPGALALGTPALSLFFWGFLLSLAVEFVAILWLLLLNRGIDHFSQVTNLYNWPLQLNLVTVTVLFAILISGQVPRTGTTLLFLFLYLAILFGSYLLTAFDLSKATPKRFRFLLSTAGLYLLLLAGGVIWIAGYSELPTVLALVLSL